MLLHFDIHGVKGLGNVYNKIKYFFILSTEISQYYRIFKLKKSIINKMMSFKEDFCLQVAIADPLVIHKIHVYETFNSGGVKIVQIMSPQQTWATVFKMDSPSPQIFKNSRIFVIFPKV